MSRFWEGHPELSSELQQVKDAILLRAASDEPDVGQAIDQLLASSGKMLRPAFVLLASRFGSPDKDRMIRIAAAVEMLHMATLVHDDIIDAAPLRRGVASLQALRGPRTAVLVGDWLFASCFSLIADISRGPEWTFSLAPGGPDLRERDQPVRGQACSAHERAAVPAQDRRKNSGSFRAGVSRRGGRERLCGGTGVVASSAGLQSGNGLSDNRRHSRFRQGRR